MRQNSAYQPPSLQRLLPLDPDEPFTQTLLPFSDHIQCNAFLMTGLIAFHYLPSLCLPSSPPGGILDISLFDLKSALAAVLQTDATIGQLLGALLFRCPPYFSIIL